MSNETATAFALEPFVSAGKTPRPESARGADDDLRAVADHLPVALWLCDPDGQRSYFNRAWLELTGVSAKRQTGEGWLELVHEDDRQRCSEALFDALNSQEESAIEYRLRRHDGVFRYLLDRFRPRFSADGVYLGLVGSAVDITERRRSEERLRLAEGYYRELIEGTDNLITQIDAEGRLTFINTRSRQIYGLEPEECVGFPFVDFVHPEDRDLTRRHFERWQRGGLSCVTFENRQVSRSGDVRDLLWTVNPHYDDSGRLSAINAIGQDITERKRAERIHRIQSQVLESMTEGVMLTNSAGFILYTNQAQDEMFGYDPGELIGQHVSLLRVPQAEDANDPSEATLAEGRAPWIGEIEQRRKDGSAFFTSARISTLEIGGVDYRVAVIADISTQKQAEAERRRLDLRVQQAQKLESLGVLAGGIAHDFNNLLMVVLGNASLALQDLEPGVPMRHDIEQIEAAAVRATDLTRQMLAYSGKGRFVVENVDLPALVREMEPLLRSTVSKNVDLVLRLESALPRVEADASQLRQVVISLLSNAAEAIGKAQGLVKLEIGEAALSRERLAALVVTEELPAGDYVFLRVTDNGSGMDEKVLARVFDPFFTTKFTGRGLGLAAVLGIVRGHRGAIQIESQPGIGTTATIYLPSKTLAADQAAAPGALVLEEEAVDLGMILVVDDEESVRDMSRRMLERLGYQVLQATSGVEALAIFAKNAPEITAILLDWSMPGMDGEETFRALRAIRQDVKVILTSGYPEQTLRERFSEKNGPSGFLQKPYRPLDLAQKIDQIVE